jgi:hypothetical protein
MRTMICALVGGALLAAAPGAMAAQPDAAIDFTFTKQKPGVSAGFNFALAVDTSESTPPPMTGITLSFAGGSAIDVTGAPACTAPIQDRIDKGHAAVCPAESQRGSGIAEVYPDGGPKIEADLAFWNVQNTKSALNVEYTVNGSRGPYFSGFYGKRAIDFKFPGNIRLGAISAEVKASSRLVDGERVNYLTTPSKCPRSGKWKMGATINYADGTHQKLAGSSRCKKR